MRICFKPSTPIRTGHPVGGSASARTPGTSYTTLPGNRSPRQQVDAVHELPFTRDAHPYYSSQGTIPALSTIRFSLSTHRGCYGECRFCAIAVHQGTRVVSRSKESVLREAASLRNHPMFKGIIADVGGPTANMYAIECNRKIKKGPCPGKSCLFPRPCPQLAIDHGPQIELLDALRSIPGIRKVFIGSGLRTDMILADRSNGMRYLDTLLCHHVSGQLKIAPEHVCNPILDLMGKPGHEQMERFIALFNTLKKRQDHKLFLTYYLMAAHPGCTLADMQTLRQYALEKLGGCPEQVQIFTPTPSTFSTLMYHTGINPFSAEPVFVEKSVSGKQRQKHALARGNNKNDPKKRKGRWKPPDRRGKTKPPQKA